MRDIKFTTQPLKGALSKSSDDCRCVIIHNELVNDDSIAKDMAETLGIDETNAQMHISLVVKYILEALGEGKKLNFGAFSLGIAMSGMVRGAKGAFEEKRNKLSVFIRGGRKLEKVLSTLHPVNASDVLKPHIKRIACTYTKKEGMVTLGKKTVMTGINIKVDELAPDEGVWLETKAGKRILRGKIISTAPTVLECRFDGELEEGEYYISLRTRCGDNSLPAPSADRRLVKVFA